MIFVSKVPTVFDVGVLADKPSPGLEAWFQRTITELDKRFATTTGSLL